MQEKFLLTTDNIKIAVNHYNLAHDAVVIIVPGWFMTKDSKAFFDISEAFSQEFDVICMDCRGHGRSGGFYTFTAKEITDVNTVVEFARQQYKRVYLAGFSLGGALAVIQGGLKKNVDGIIAVSVPSSFRKIENYMWHPNAWIPTLQKFEPLRWISIRPSLIPHRMIKPFDVIDDVEVPTLFIAGGKDVTVKPWHTKELYKKAVCKKKYEFFPECIHAEDIFLQSRERFMQVCLDWLQADKK